LIVLGGVAVLALTLALTYLAITGPRIDYIDPSLPLAIHQHVRLVVYLGTERVVIPSGVGIDLGGERIIHTHDESGILHIEDNKVREYSLGDFFELWGKPLSSDCLLDYCSNETHKVWVFLNGELWEGDPNKVPLLGGSEIILVYGTEEQASIARETSSGL
jgi:hypothetical protein